MAELRAVIPLRDVAERMGVSPRACKRRLLNLNRKIGGLLLMQFAPGGNYFADRVLLLRHLPALVRGDDEDPVEATQRHVVEVKAMVGRVLQILGDSARQEDDVCQS